MLLPVLPLAPTAITWLDPGLGNGTPRESSFVELADGRVFAVWVFYGGGPTSSIRCGYAPSVAAFVGANNSVTAQTNLAVAGATSACVQRIGADLYLTCQIQQPAPGVFDPSFPDPGGSGVFVYRSTDEAVSWTVIGSIPTGQAFGAWSGPWGNWTRQGEIFVTSSGRWVVCHQHFALAFGADGGIMGVATSDDQGATWTHRFQYASAIYGATIKRQLQEWTDGQLYFAVQDGGTVFLRDAFVSSADDGVNWTAYQLLGVTGAGPPTESPLKSYGAWNLGSAAEHVMAVDAGPEIWTATLTDPTTAGTSNIPIAAEEWTLFATWVGGPANSGAGIFQPATGFAVYITSQILFALDAADPGSPQVSSTLECLGACQDGSHPIVHIVLTNLGGDPISFFLNGIGPIVVFAGTPVLYDYCYTEAASPCEVITITVEADGVPLPDIVYDGTVLCCEFCEGGCPEPDVCPPLDIQGLVTCREDAILGDGHDLRVLLMSRGGGSVIAELNPVSGSFTRELDATSKLTMDGVVTGRLGSVCCDGWDEVYPWATEVLVYRGGRDAWCGPVTEVTFGYGTVHVEASDLTAWWDRRVLPDMAFNGVDLGIIFQQVHDAAMAPDPSPNINIIVEPTGIIGSRLLNSSTYTYASDFLNELGKTDLDYTAFGRNVIVHGAEIDVQPYFTLMDEYWSKPPEIVERGNEQATVVVVLGHGVQSVATAPKEFLDYYGLLVRVFTEDTILDQGSCDVAAQSRVDLLRNPVYIDTPTGAQLNVSTPILLEQLIPGSRVRVDSQSTCRKIVSDFRLQKVTVNFNGQVSIDLQPIGSLEDLEAQTAATGGGG